MILGETDSNNFAAVSISMSSILLLASLLVYAVSLDSSSYSSSSEASSDISLSSESSCSSVPESRLHYQGEVGIAKAVVCTGGKAGDLLFFSSWHKRSHFFVALLSNLINAIKCFR